MSDDGYFDERVAARAPLDSFTSDSDKHVSVSEKPAS
jgi:hypothetical protein